MTKEVHEPRPAIADDCVVGVCSVNNCLYPTCSRAYIEQRNQLSREVHGRFGYEQREAS